MLELFILYLSMMTLHAEFYFLDDTGCFAEFCRVYCQSITGRVSGRVPHICNERQRPGAHPPAGQVHLVTLARPLVSSSLQITNQSFTYASPYLCNQLPSSFHQPHSVHCPPGSPHPAHITSSQSPPSQQPSDGLSSGVISIYCTVHESSITAVSGVSLASTISELSDISAHCNNNNDKQHTKQINVFYKLLCFKVNSAK